MNKLTSKLTRISPSRLIRFCLLLMLSLATVSHSGCKSKKKLLQEQEMREAAAKASEIENAKAALLALLNDNEMSLDEKERKLNAIKNKNIDDAEVQSLIRQVEEMIAQQRAKLEEERRLRAEQMAKEKAEKEAAARKSTLSNFFKDISKAGSADVANSSIQQALGMFASPEAPVLIIINENRNDVDYDKPTNITDYLNYLKDTSNNKNSVKSLAVDENGKITELVLTKN